jgi:integrase
MRQGELFGLQWPDIDFEAGSVYVQRTLEEIKGRFKLKELKTTKSKRRIDLSRTP